jgi:subtilisin family serine protease
VKIVEDSLRGLFAHGYDIGQAIYFAAASGAKVMSCSWEFNDVGWQYVQEAIKDAVSPNPPSRHYGCVIIFSAGNSGEAAKVKIGFPARLPEVITVGAVDKYGDKWSYSEIGDPLDVMAPSGDKGNVYTRPGDMWTLDQIGEPGSNPPKFLPAWTDTDDLDYTMVFGGTSGAAPQVAGIAAMVLARRTDFFRDVELRDTLNRVLKYIIDSSAIDLAAPGWDDSTGYGIANAYRALLSVIRGDMDNDGYLTASDVSWMVDYFMASGPPAALDERVVDIDCDGNPTVLDLGRLIDIVFAGDPLPDPCFDFAPWQ